MAETAMLIDILVFPGFDEIDAIAPLEVLRMAARRGAQATTRLVTLEHRRTVRGCYGVTVVADAVHGGDADVLVLVGGGWIAGAQVGVLGEIQSGRLGMAARKHHAGGGQLAAVCTGAMVLSAAGLLSGREAATHPRAMRSLGADGALPVAARVVDDGDIVSSGGVTASTDLALHLVHRYWGDELADDVAAGLDYRRSSDVHFGQNADRTTTGR
jgi:transcriptional regulator GlxA family with amidase domain